MHELNTGPYLSVTVVLQEIVILTTSFSQLFENCKEPLQSPSSEEQLAEKVGLNQRLDHPIILSFSKVLNTSALHHLAEVSQLDHF